MLIYTLQNVLRNRQTEMAAELGKYVFTASNPLPLYRSYCADVHHQLFQAFCYGEKKSTTAFIPISAQSAWVGGNSIFVARINSKIYDFGHFQANIQSN